MIDNDYGIEVVSLHITSKIVRLWRCSNFSGRSVCLRFSTEFVFWYLLIIYCTVEWDFVTISAITLTDFRSFRSFIINSWIGTGISTSVREFCMYFCLLIQNWRKIWPPWIVWLEYFDVFIDNTNFHDSVRKLICRNFCSICIQNLSTSKPIAGFV